ncbi:MULTISPECIES: UDP-N-acetylglucosamine 1-carboxyvinyltransferase [Bacillales]|uniref:UDP-N-acetylglucosamine 1-carboxyvinyltransferase n=1 Tax=Brevibacillus brevis (strain 47 / JCM 6285 / NBRC 100599) TaxID=358681 RepID=C0ZGA3_BREBN|nr:MULTISPECIES: UDP-N-acetylglucosamine 1-carboxyvinyltransferase [Bacillales]KMZ40175.1 UDP-N-acetylglucosamine 1-carboxyvinyltransferase [Bacillus sp. FJAT-27238]MBH0333494.1 UDP-N-acetylglucosamine 1-carboxyvinyltransferase [Brevibacillus brevis]MBY0088606.1 UDP-N-acetylglucosamine 1-carboxyvinyltransferase [Brevibacillus brevis]MCC8437166.1 UDP-N-acetylglucosamine 1-carboxyvinyltransferase [Brevibacillus sp. M2.1A]MCE0449756.1 UDP-N-acetylglucosamine 1-carboxyvinyltransferase [Brevibacill
METFAIEGGRPLSGSLRIQGAKNAALPILAAAVLAEGQFYIYDVPHLKDIKVMLEILTLLGANTKHEDGCVDLDTTSVCVPQVPDDLMSQMRSSIFLAGPLLARLGEVTISRPGGCDIGERRIDLHLAGLTALGAKIEESEGYITFRAKQLRGSNIFLSFPSVGATENIMMAAVLAKGTTRICNAAREPEIIDLQNFLNAMGARIRGAGTDTIEISGVPRLRSVSYRIIPDRIVTGTYLLAVGISQGHIELTNTLPEQLMALIEVARSCGVEIKTRHDIMEIKSTSRPRAYDRIITSPYPGFPTDLQAQLMVFLSQARGTSVIKETIFEGRFKHVNELARMGASIYVDLGSAIIRGVNKLTATNVEATDLRAGAALVLAGLAAEGITTVNQIHHIDRGYDRLEEQLRQLGADISRVSM